MARPVKIIRWTLKQASEEFGVHIHKLTRMLKSAGIRPDAEDGMFSTMDIVKAVVDPLSEKLKLAQIDDTTKAAALKDVRTKTLLKENVPIAIVEKVWSDFIVDLVQKINNLDLPDKARKEVLADLQQIDVEKYFNGRVAEKDEDEDEG